mmetsp:Transcript_28950/g.52391  ORF Transcript_28950/g.52391 Transcript_28950/m.52391 type:complete len:117 (+) Transcript_28950:332-682(+)
MILRRGTQCLLDHYKIFEKVSFPTKFPTGTETFCSQKRKGAQELSFREYYHLSSRLLTHNPTKYVIWHCCCRLIDKGLELIKQRACVGTLGEKRHVSFLDPFCLFCSWFARCHETL